MEKIDVFKQVEAMLTNVGIDILNKDDSRPWGGFFVIDELQAQKFADLYFNGIDVETLKISGKLSPKILVVAPNSRLSWQYHNRRAEIWQVIKGTVGVKTSFTDQEGALKTLKAGDSIKLQQGERHRLIGLEDWALIAEIWQHINPDHPTDEEDIIRLQDDYGR